MQEREIDQKRELGIIASGSKRDEIIFYCSQETRTDYVCTYRAEEKQRTIFEIIDVDVYNKRLADVDFVRYIGEQENYERYNIYRCKAKPRVTIDENNQIVEDIWYIAKPGTHVYEASMEDIVKTNDVEVRENKQRIGTLIRDKRIPVWISLPSLLTTHMSIIGRSGQGKSNLTEIMLKNIPMKFVLFTPAKEYLNVKGAEHIDADEVEVSFDVLQERKVVEFNNSELMYLNQYVFSQMPAGKVYSSELSVKIQEYFWNIRSGYQQGSLFEANDGRIDRNVLPQYVNSLCLKLEEADLLVNFDENKKVCEQSRVINTQKLSMKKEEILIYCELNQLLSERRKKYRKSNSSLKLEDRIVIFLEEAHNYIPSNKATLCKDVINQIARQGRKLGIHLVLLSQRPRYLDPTALAQCGTVITFNLTNPDDIEYVMTNSNFYGENYKKIIQDLKIGECILVSDYMHGYIGCKVDFFA